MRIHAVDRRLDAHTRQQLIDGYVAGSPTTALMEQFNLGKGTVLGVLRRAGVELRNQGLKPDDLTRAVRLYESGLSLKEVASRVACDAETVRKELRAAGVVMRKPWERTAAQDCAPISILPPVDDQSCPATIVLRRIDHPDPC